MTPNLMTRLPELVELERIVDGCGPLVRVDVLGNAHYRELSFPLYSIEVGCEDPTSPVLCLIGGVHGLERIGTKVLISYLKTVLELFRWDHAIQRLLEKSRLLFIPLINPGGMYLKYRANPRGVDLMRNAPIHGDRISKLALFSGHRISPRLPWYRGAAGEPMQVESQALCDLVQQRLYPSRVAVSVDVHSGFGSRDRLWFPYAKTRKPFPHLAELMALKDLLDSTYPNHIYVVEPQSTQYLAHGDLWDYLFEEHKKRKLDGFFLPLTLELGSWLWARKNWKQVFNPLGMYNPLIPHRLQRTLRRHLLLFDFLQRAVTSCERWLDLTAEEKPLLTRRALELWYGR